MITYSYVPSTWDQESFLRLGGYVVVFLNFNKKRFIEKSVASALNQDFPLLEMFFMDDASSDGSDGMMEKIVRQYRGRHKVTVVRNEVNAYITGQWNIVSKLATGNWLGMFCGDDVAHPDRVSLVAERIRKFPTLRGIATAAVDIDPWTGKPLPDSHYVPKPYFAYGTDSWAELAANFKSNGSTSFWHKSLFVDPIPKVPLDDNYLHFRVYVLNRGVEGPVFLYDSDVKTIDYSLGAGVCGGGMTTKAEDSPWRRWTIDILRYKKFLAKMTATMEAAIGYAIAKGVCIQDVSPFVCHWWWCRIRSANTLKRLGLLLPLGWFLTIGKARFKSKVGLVKTFCYFSALEFLGVRCASFVRGFWR